MEANEVVVVVVEGVEEEEEAEEGGDEEIDGRASARAALGLEINADREIAAATSAEQIRSVVLGVKGRARAACAGCGSAWKGETRRGIAWKSENRGEEKEKTKEIFFKKRKIISSSKN